MEVETNRYPVPFAWCGAEVAVELSAPEVRIVHQGEPLVYQYEPERHRVIRWQGEPRPMYITREGPGEPPRFDPSWLARAGQATARPLAAYAVLLAEVSTSPG